MNIESLSIATRRFWQEHFIAPGLLARYQAMTVDQLQKIAHEKVQLFWAQERIDPEICFDIIALLCVIPPESIGTENIGFCCYIFHVLIDESPVSHAKIYIELEHAFADAIPIESLQIAPTAILEPASLYCGSSLLMNDVFWDNKARTIDKKILLTHRIQYGIGLLDNAISRVTTATTLTVLPIPEIGKSILDLLPGADATLKNAYFDTMAKLPATYIINIDMLLPARRTVYLGFIDEYLTEIQTLNKSRLAYIVPGLMPILKLIEPMLDKTAGAERLALSQSISARLEYLLRMPWKNIKSHHEQIAFICNLIWKLNQASTFQKLVDKSFLLFDETKDVSYLSLIFNLSTIFPQQTAYRPKLITEVREKMMLFFMGE